MSEEVILALIAMVSGGGLTAIANTWIEHSKLKRVTREKDIDERITVWQKISEKNESRLELLERKLDSYDRDFRCLERYILSLEQTIVRAGPPLELPERPLLEKDLLARGSA
jgi:hypothetical protein